MYGVLTGESAAGSKAPDVKVHGLPAVVRAVATAGGFASVTVSVNGMHLARDLVGSARLQRAEGLREHCPAVAPGRVRGGGGADTTGRGYEASDSGYVCCSR